MATASNLTVRVYTVSAEAVERLHALTFRDGPEELFAVLRNLFPKEGFMPYETITPSHAERLNDLTNRFTYHPPQDGQPEKYTAIRAKALELAILVGDLTPFGRERATAITKLEEAVMWANAAIARGEQPSQ